MRANRHYLDWTNQPRPCKRYARELAQVALPSETAAAGAGLDASLVSTLLQLSAGITKWLQVPGGQMAFRAAACTGALYHIDLYVVCADLPGIPAGVYHFDVEHVALSRLREGDFRGVLVEATAGDERIRHAPLTLVAASTWWRNAWKYQARTYRHAFWDSGTILANLLAVAAAHLLPAAILLGFVDSAVNGLLDLDPAREAALELVPIGSGAVDPPAPPPVGPLRLPVHEYSFTEVDYPLIRQVHQATALPDSEHVAAWRTPPTPPSPIEGGEGPAIHEVIRRRGSARAFLQTPIATDALDALLAAAFDQPPNDWAGPLADPHLIVNAVDGLASGAYRWDRGSGRLTPLMLGDHRQIAGHLDLDQELAEDAAVNVYFLADLVAILDRLGERGYRAAQLDAALAAGRMYLAAYRLGLAATGLTFFDDEVSAFFGTDDSVMFLLALGNRRPLQRRA